MLQQQGLRRPSMLDEAREATSRQVSARVRRLAAPASSVVIGVLRQVEQPPEFPETRVLVDVGGGSAWLIADPAAYVVGGTVYVEVDSQRRPRRVTGPTGVPVPDSTVPTTVEQGAIPVVIQPAAMIDAAARRQANDALEQLTSLFTHSDRAPNVADGEGKPEGAYWILTDDEGADAARWRWVEGAWVEAPLGPELILSEAVIYSLLSNEVFTKLLVLSDEADGWIVRNTARGIEIFNPDGEAMSRYGAFAENALNFYRGGQPVASMGDSGVVYGEQGAFDTLEVGGTDVRELFEDRPRGVVYDRNFPLSRRMTTLGGHSYITLDMEQGRLYEVRCRVWVRNLDSKGVTVRFFQNNANLGNFPGAPSVAGGNSSAEIVSFTLGETGDSPFFTVRDLSFTFAAPGTVDKTVNLLVGAEPWEAIGAGQLEFARAWWTVYDIGRTGTPSGGSYSESGGGSAGGGTNPTPEQPKQRYTKRYNSTEWRTFQNVGTGSESRTTSVSGPTQGRTPYYPSAGRYGSHWYFDVAQIQADLAGATVVSARVKLTCTHTHANSGGTARLHIHGYSTSGEWASPDFVGDVGFTKGQSRWMGVTYQGWRTGAVRGVGVYSRGSDSTEYYMRFGAQAVLEIVYEK